MPKIFPILFHLIVLRLTPSSSRPYCDTWVKSENVSVCEIDVKDRPDVYKMTTAKQFPHAVLVYCMTGQDHDNLCSGTLVADSWVLTAKHCLDECHSSYIYAGGNSLSELTRKEYPEGYQIKMIETTCLHKTFDVALAKVEKKFTLTEYVNTISLPTRPLPQAVASCNFTAFGRVMLSEHLPELDYKRKTQEVKVVSPCDCYYWDWRETQVSWVKVADGTSFICSLPRKNFGVCRGDSGSGLVYEGVLHGVTTSIFTHDNIETCIFHNPFTRMLSCGSQDTTSIFVAVFPIVDWIDKIAIQDEIGRGYCLNNAKANLPCLLVFLLAGSAILTRVY